MNPNAETSVSVRKMDVSSTWLSPIQGLSLAVALCVAAIALRRRAGARLQRLLDGIVLTLVLTPLFSKFFLLLALSGTSLQALPLHVCDFAGVFCATALVTRNADLATIGVLTASLLSSLAICQPDLGSGPTFLEQLLFWTRHFSLLLAAAYLVFAVAMPLTWRGYALWAALVLSYAAAALVLNPILGTNFGYLTPLTTPPAILKALGPWPDRVVLMVLGPLSLGALATALVMRFRSRGGD